jgi:hypothetical protein
MRDSGHRFPDLRAAEILAQLHEEANKDADESHIITIHGAIIPAGGTATGQGGKGVSSEGGPHA